MKLRDDLPFFIVLEVELEVSCLLVKCSTTELHPTPSHVCMYVSIHLSIRPSILEAGSYHVAPARLKLTV